MNRRKILSGAQLKYIAFTSMLIDHVNKALIYPNLNGGILLVISDIFDVLGRIAFPIFMFLLIEGYFRTTNRWKYLGIEKDSVTAWREALSFSYLIAIFLQDIFYLHTFSVGNLCHLRSIQSGITMHSGIGQISIHPVDLGQILAAAFRTHIHLQLLVSAVITVGQ